MLEISDVLESGVILPKSLALLEDHVDVALDLFNKWSQHIRRDLLDGGDGVELGECRRLVDLLHGEYS